MGHPEGARETCDVRKGFDHHVRLKFHRSKDSGIAFGYVQCLLLE